MSIAPIYPKRNPQWGLLGPQDVASERRTRTLGLASAVRRFNDLAVPGLGGVWFAKPLILSALGVAVATRAGRSNIEVANSIEALACRLALQSHGWKAEPRLRGREKLRGRDDLSYLAVHKPSFYVTQPMRQQTVQPLLVLGLVDSEHERFNSYQPSAAGRLVIISAFSDFRPGNKSVEDFLVDWVKGMQGSIRSQSLSEALSPLNSLPLPCREALAELFIQGAHPNALRRRASLAWVDRLRLQRSETLTWDERPVEIGASHWQDLRVGAQFFRARDAALAVLDAVEQEIAPRSNRTLSLAQPIPSKIASTLESLRAAAHTFIAEHYDPTSNLEATNFCQECIQEADAHLLSRLAFRDGRGLVQRGQFLMPGAAFRGLTQVATPAAEDLPELGAELGRQPLWPEAISYRLRNLFLLNVDLKGQLDDWLAPPEDRT